MSSESSYARDRALYFARGAADLIVDCRTWIRDMKNNDDLIIKVNAAIRDVDHLTREIYKRNEP